MDLSSIAANELGLPSGASGGGFQAGGFFSPGGVKDAFGACAGLTPLNLDYSTIQHYFEGNMSAEQHIISGHISPGQPGNSMYAFYPPQAPAQAFYQVQGYNAATFLNPDNRSVGSNGNLIFDREFPVLPNPFADGADSYIGVSPQGTPLTNNRLILKPDCKTVRTSYPTP